MTSTPDGTGGMGRRVRWLAGQLLPPLIAEPIRRARHRNDPPPRAPGPTEAPEASASGGTPVPAEWEHLPGGWPENDPAIRGWEAASVADTMLARWPEFVASMKGTGPFGLEDGEATPTVYDYGRHNTVVTFGYVLARVAAGRSALSMLDWGGGIGRYRVYAESLLPGVTLDYHCKELPLLARAGREAQPDATFHEDEASALARRYDLVLASGSLHYTRDWKAALERIAAVADGYLFVTRQPFVATAPSYVVVQRPYRFGYQTEYAGWFLNRDEFLEAARGFGLVLEREFLIDERPPVVGAPEPADYRGFLFRAPARAGA